MRLLFAISIVALLLLLWASFSIAWYIRRARQRRLDEQETVPSAPAPDSAAHRSPPPPVPGSFAKPAERGDWAYFNKDMGDLSDPYQPSRIRSKSHAE